MTFPLQITFSLTPGTSATATARKQTPYFYQLNGEILQVIPNTPYLGVTLSTDLKFNIHLNKKIA